MLITENYKNIKFSNNKLQIFDYNVGDKIQKNYKTGFWQFLKSVLNDFIENCTFHGLDWIFKKNLNAFKRFFWICGFIIAIIIFIYVSQSIGNIQRANPMVTVISNSHYPIYKIPFPELTICNKNRLNWQRYGSAKENFLKSLHQSNKYEDIFKEVLNAFDTLNFGEFNKFENLLKIPAAQLEELNYVNFTLVVEFMAWKCHELFSECKWLNRYYNCCEIFFMRKSQMGACLAFNTIESEEGKKKQASDPYWPWRTNAMGMNKGLKVNVHIRENMHTPQNNNTKGILLMITEPQVWYYRPEEINTHTRTTVAFSAILQNFDNYTRLFSSDMRQCVFDDEVNSMYYKSLQGYRYMFENCQAECQQEYLVKYCNCTMDLFFPTGPYKVCKLSDFPCLHQYNDKLKFFEEIGESNYVLTNRTNSMKCDCYFNCKSLTYMTYINDAHMSTVKMEANNTFIDLSLFFLRNFITVFQTTATYKWTDLMAGFGGLLGLCIGCSLISLIEIFYFLVVDIPKQSFYYIKSQKYFKLKRKTQDIKVLMVNTTNNASK